MGDFSIVLLMLMFDNVKTVLFQVWKMNIWIMFKWKVSGLGGGSSKKANKGQDKLNNANVENNNDNDNTKNNKNNQAKEAKSPSKK